MKIVGRTHHYLVSAVGSRWRETSLLMFTLFLDDSGTRPTHKIAVATALVIPGAQIVRLESEWKKFKEKEDFDCFHASPCNAADGEFRSWDDTKIDRAFARVRQISKKYGILAVSASVKKSYFDETVPDQYRKYTYKHHYSWCVSYAIAYAAMWKDSRNIGYPFEFIFSWMNPESPERDEIERVMDYSERAEREKGRSGEYVGYTFRPSQEIPGLQCVDDVAWVCNRYALYKIEQKDLPQRAKLGWDAYGGESADAGWLRAFTFTRENLRKHVDGIIREGETIKRFQRWEREDREKKNGI